WREQYGDEPVAGFLFLPWQPVAGHKPGGESILRRYSESDLVALPTYCGLLAVAEAVPPVHERESVPQAAGKLAVPLVHLACRETLLAWIKSSVELYGR